MYLKLFSEAVGGVALLLAAERILAAATIHQQHFFRKMMIMGRLALNGQQWFKLFSAALLLFDMTRNFLRHSDAYLLFSLWCDLGIFVYIFVRSLSPPSILFLAASQHRGITETIKLSMMAAPLKIVHLIRAYIEIEPGEGHSLFGMSVILVLVRLDGYRVKHDWQGVVATLSEISPLIVIDARAPSSHLAEELKHNAESGYANKTFIFYDESGLLKGHIVPALQTVSYPIANNLHLVPSTHLIEALHNMAWRVVFSREHNLVKALERNLEEVIKKWGDLKDDAGRCHGCGTPLDRVLKWQDELSFEENIRIKSYSIPHILQCRICGLRYCEECALHYRMRCRVCQEVGLRTGYPTIPGEVNSTQRVRK